MVHVQSRSLCKSAANCSVKAALMAAREAVHRGSSSNLAEFGDPALV